MIGDQCQIESFRSHNPLTPSKLNSSGIVGYSDGEALLNQPYFNHRPRCITESPASCGVKWNEGALFVIYPRMMEIIQLLLKLLFMSLAKEVQ